jgi:hypothetical protein
MSASIALGKRQTEQVDRSALLLMLSYIEAECRRIGATAAAEYAALAAALVPPGHRMPAARAAPAGTGASRRRKRASPLH